MLSMMMAMKAIRRLSSNSLHPFRERELSHLFYPSGFNIQKNGWRETGESESGSCQSHQNFPFDFIQNSNYGCMSDSSISTLQTNYDSKSNGIDSGWMLSGFSRNPRHISNEYFYAMESKDWNSKGFASSNDTKPDIIFSSPFHRAVFDLKNFRNVENTFVKNSHFISSSVPRFFVSSSSSSLLPSPSPPIELFKFNSAFHGLFSKVVPMNSKRIMERPFHRVSSDFSGKEISSNPSSPLNSTQSTSKPLYPAIENFSALSNSLKNAFFDPLGKWKHSVSGYREAAGFQLEAFWKRNSLILISAVGFGAILLLWRFMFGVASTFIDLSQGLAKYGFLALASSFVAFLGLYFHSRHHVNPDKVYRLSMRLLNTNAGVLEVMGAPLTGSDVRAYVMSGGGIRFRNWKLRLASKRCFLLFPVRGSERKGIVSVEVKKKNGKYDFKMMAVDVPTAGFKAADQRLYVIGNESTYLNSGGVLSELRDPIVFAMSKQKDFDVEDDKEDEEELGIKEKETAK